MTTMQAIARANEAHDRAIATTRAKLADPAILDRLTKHTSALGAGTCAITVLYMIDAAYGAATADRIRADYASVDKASRAAIVEFWATVLPLREVA